VRQQPQYSLPYGILMRKTNLNHLHFVCDDDNDNLRAVKQLDVFLKQTSATVKPILLHCDHVMCVTDPLKQLMPVISRLRAMRTPVYAVIDTPIPLFNFIPTLFCNKTYMYEHVSIVFTLRSVQNIHRESTLRDTVANTTYLYAMICKLLKQATALPQALIKGLDTEIVLLSSHDCKRYGLVDEVIRL
jgi:hypothetical protein